jgi:hypothetical protein
MSTAPNALMGGGGGPPNPNLAAILGALQNKTASPAKNFSEQSAELQGADPTMVLRQLEQINSLLGVLFVKTFEKLPNIANNISATMKALSRAIKEAQQGSSVSEVVGKGEAGGPPPINFSPAMGGGNSSPGMSVGAP